MMESMRNARHALAVACCLWIGLNAGLASSQNDVSTPSTFAPDALVGQWAIPFPNEGGPPVFGTVAYRPDGSYEETLIIGGETAGWWRGRYTLAPDGTLSLEESETSPQLCFAGQCEPNDPPTSTVARLETVTPSSFTATFVDEGGIPASLTFQRVASGAGTPQPGPGGVSGVTTVPAIPMTPGADAATPGVPSTGAAGAGPLAPAPATPQPGAGAAAADADPWLGTWTDGDVTVRFDVATGVSLEVDGAVYPMRLSGDDARLEGTFGAGDQSYEIVLQRSGGGMTVTSGGATYSLQRQGGASGSGNPLGGP